MSKCGSSAGRAHGLGLGYGRALLYCARGAASGSRGRQRPGARDRDPATAAVEKTPAPEEGLHIVRSPIVVRSTSRRLLDLHLL